MGIWLRDQEAELDGRYAHSTFESLVLAPNVSSLYRKIGSSDTFPRPQKLPEAM